MDVATDGSVDVRTSRMLKKSACDVLASYRSSTYPKGYVEVFHSLWPCRAAFMSILYEHSPSVPHVWTIEVLVSDIAFLGLARRDS